LRRGAVPGELPAQLLLRGVAEQIRHQPGGRRLHPHIPLGGPGAIPPWGDPHRRRPRPDLAPQPPPSPRSPPSRLPHPGAPPPPAPLPSGDRLSRRSRPSTSRGTALPCAPSPILISDRTSARVAGRLPRRRTRP
jgi:hypothetical protein